MPDDHPDQLPLEAVRDLLGLVRALYGAGKRDGLGPIEMEELRSIGEDLRDALKMAKNSKPFSMPHRAAWKKAERATLRLGDIISEHMTVLYLLSKQSERIGFTAPYQRLRFDPHLKIKERIKRG